MPSANCDRRNRRGYTLLEMLILVALLALVAGLSWPSLRRLSQKRELLESARQIRVELLRTRLDAIESGTARQFRYQLGSGLFESTTFSASDTLQAGDAWEEDAELPPDTQADLGLVDQSSDSDGDENRLPTGVFFVAPDSDPQAVAETAIEDVGNNLQWSAPILFYPNGRTLNARLELSNGEYAVDITLRGLTGTARIGQVRRLVDDSGESLGEVP
jgi:type II secretory pathway pseudopilin PulG